MQHRVISASLRLMTHGHSQCCRMSCTLRILDADLRALRAVDSSLTRITLASDEARHLREVLRLKVGDEVYVFNGAGKEFQCRVAETRRDAAHLMVVREVDAARPESPLHLTLAVALLKGEKFDLVVQKATELGVP